jgi:hypothetical protein
MPAYLAFLLAFTVLTMTATAAEEDCPKHFENYGLFLQAKKSCAKEADYPFMKIMKACARQTPQETALTMMDGGRRTWARGVMRSSLGSMCDEVFSKLSAASEPRKR